MKTKASPATLFKHGTAVSLALGGGGSRGSAQIGVLRVLEREGIHVAALAGSSIGGLIAAVYAAGYGPEALAEQMGALELGKLLHVSLRAPDAILSLDGVEAILNDLLGERRFEDLDTPLSLTALDLVSGHEVVLKEGPLVNAVMATIALPGIFPSRQIGDYQLVDGGISNPTPVAVARSLAPSFPVVAVPLAPALGEEKGGGTSQADMQSLPFPSQIKRLKWGRAFISYMNAMNISGHIQGEVRMYAEHPEVVIRPDVEDIGVLAEVDVNELVRRGEQAAEAALPELHRQLQPTSLRAIRRLIPDK